MSDRAGNQTERGAEAHICVHRCVAGLPLRVPHRAHILYMYKHCSGQFSVCVSGKVSASGVHGCLSICPVHLSVCLSELAPHIFRVGRAGSMGTNDYG